jgi:quercetin dioxygenase-like cupin family protein
MSAVDVHAVGGGLAELIIRPGMSEANAERSMQYLAPFNQCTLGVVRFSGQTPWERHPEGDELLHVLAGETRVTLLGDDGPTDVTVRVGSIFVVPRGTWHRQVASLATTLFFASPTETTEHSWADDPRRR